MGTGLDMCGTWWMGCTCPPKSRHQSKFPESGAGEESSSHSRNALFRCPSPWPATASCPRATVGYMTYLTFNVILEPVFGSQQAHCLGFFASSVSKQRHLSRRQTTKEFSWQNQRTTATHQTTRTSPPQKLLHTDSFTHRRFHNQTLSHTEAFTQTFFRPTPLGFRQVVPHVQLHVAKNR